MPSSDCRTPPRAAPADVVFGRAGADGWQAARRRRRRQGPRLRFSSEMFGEAALCLVKRIAGRDRPSARIHCGSIQASRLAGMRSWRAHRSERDPSPEPGDVSASTFRARRPMRPLKRPAMSVLDAARTGRAVSRSSGSGLALSASRPRIEETAEKRLYVDDRQRITTSRTHTGAPPFPSACRRTGRRRCARGRAT